VNFAIVKSFRNLEALRENTVSSTVNHIKSLWFNTIAILLLFRMKSSLKISFRNSSFQRQSHLLCVCSEAFQIRYLPLIFGIKSCWRVSQSVTHKHELWIRFTLSYAMMKALHLTWHSATHKRERRIWFPLIYRHLMKALLRLAAVRDTKQAGELRGDTTIYCLEFCAGFNDAKRQHLSTINTNNDLSFTTIQQQTYCRKQLIFILTECL